MSLRYPNLRLAIYNRLVTQEDCTSAFAETARECGLKCPEDLSRVKREVAAGACGSLTTARKVLQETVPEVAEALSQHLLAGVEQYKLESKKKHCRGLNLEPTVIDCSRMAPVVMDLLLQLVEQYAPRETD